MPATISTTYIHPELEQSVRTAVEGFFKNYAGNRTVSIVAAQNNSVWVLSVTTPDGQRESVRRLPGEYGGHDIENILKALEEITAEVDPSQS
jgi:hypothetical protein